MDSSFEQRLSRSPLLPALGAGYLLVSADPFADGNTVSLVLLFGCGLWLTYSFSRFAKSGGMLDWLLGK